MEFIKKRTSTLASSKDKSQKKEKKDKKEHKEKKDKRDALRKTTDPSTESKRSSSRLFQSFSNVFSKSSENEKINRRATEMERPSNRGHYSSFTLDRNTGFSEGNQKANYGSK